MSLKPGKGLHQVLTQEVLDFLQGALDNVGDWYNDDIHDESPVDVIDQLVAESVIDIEPAEGPDARYTWTREKDNFGDKAYVAIPFQEGALRVTVVLTKKNELRLDIRSWYEG